MPCAGSAGIRRSPVTLLAWPRYSQGMAHARGRSSSLPARSRTRCEVHSRTGQIRCRFTAKPRDERPVLTTAVAALANNPPPELPGFLNTVGSQLNHYGYWAVLLLVTLEDFGIPVPGETILIAAAIFAGAGRLNIVLVGVVGFIAAVIGDNIGFAIGHFGGRALALRWGKYVFLTEERLTKAQYFFERHGGKIIIVARFIEGLRQANGIIAGISGMHWRRFVFFNAIGAALWVGTWVTLGYLAGNHITTIYHYITQYSLYALIAAVVLAATFIIWHVLRRRRRVTQRAPHQPQ